MIMSRPAGSARWISVVAVAILLGGLVLVSFVVESGKSSLLVSFAAVGGRWMVIGTNGGLADQRRTLKNLRDGDDPLSSSKRRVPNGPDPIHNRGAGESGRSPGRA
ncbi:hypothetical protein C2845_PM04G05160 [Panicum miliaceum]|uniref:CLAVATA3/ESR (CLE)-related protein 25-like n=1 Tax=Panicum miliaceum TaxID=4540 RepID=A0A3L6QRB4_PANMI|nr:hypothetical protein C2845_PM04G05160 [Panicum miliaceum]